jgi:hypothetical protein
MENELAWRQLVFHAERLEPSGRRVGVC